MTKTNPAPTTTPKAASLAAAGYVGVALHPVLAARAIRAQQPANSNGERARKAVRHG